MVRLTILASRLSLDTSTGEISGTPTAITSSASYTITASNTGGSDTATVTIVVNDVAPSSVTQSKFLYSDKGYNYDCSYTIYSGGPVTSWSVSPSFQQGCL